MVSTATELSLRDLRTPEEIDELQREWDGLVASAPRPSPFLLATWVSAWLREYADEYEPCITVATRGAELVGIRPSSSAAAARVRVAEFVGGHESALADILLAAGEPITTAEQLLQPLAHSAAHVLNASGLPGDSVLARAAGEAPAHDPARGIARARDARRLAGRATSGAPRSSGARGSRGTERQLRELGSLEVVVACDGPAVDAALDEAFAIHRLRWEGRPDGSSFGRPERRTSRAGRSCSSPSRGRFGICVLRLDGRGIAFASWLEVGTTMYGHRTAYDPALSRYGARADRAAARPSPRAATGACGASSSSARSSDYHRALSDRLDPTHQGLGLARGLKGRLYVARTLATIEARKRLKKHERLHRLYRSGALRIRRPATPALRRLARAGTGRCA